MVCWKVNRKALVYMLLAAAAAAGIPAITTAQQSVPVIEGVTMREDDNGRYPVVYPEFHFHDSSGSVRFIHRVVVATNAPRTMAVRDGLIAISARQQMLGATFVGGWPCGPETYYVTLQAFMVNLDGGKSNVVQYTIHCNGG